MTETLPDLATQQPRCGWPFQIVETSTIVNCQLPVGHDGPWCILLDSEGQRHAAAPRFARRGVAR